MTEHPTIVLDNGGGYLRLGFATQSRPLEEPNCSAIASRGKGKQAVVFGKEALSLPFYRLLRPARRGLPLDMAHQASIWEAALARLFDGERPSNAK
ncbi:unnamed protein product, partial [Symbiodinium necroappetens]